MLINFSFERKTLKSNEKKKENQEKIKQKKVWGGGNYINLEFKRLRLGKYPLWINITEIFYYLLLNLLQTVT